MYDGIAVIVEDAPDAMGGVRFDVESLEEAKEIVELAFKHLKSVTMFPTYTEESEDA